MLALKISATFLLSIGLLGNIYILYSKQKDVMQKLTRWLTHVLAILLTLVVIVAVILDPNVPIPVLICSSWVQALFHLSNAVYLSSIFIIVSNTLFWTTFRIRIIQTIVFIVFFICFGGGFTQFILWESITENNIWAKWGALVPIAVAVNCLWSIAVAIFITVHLTKNKQKVEGRDLKAAQAIQKCKRLLLYFIIMPIFELLLFALGGSIRQATGEETVSHLIELHAFAFSSLGAVMFSLLFESVFGMVSTKKPIIAPPPSDVDTAPSEMDTVKVK